MFYIITIYIHHIDAISSINKSSELIPFQHDQSPGTHPEGPNIGYNSNSSWFDNKQNEDDDKLQSHTKGNTAKFVDITDFHIDKF